MRSSTPVVKALGYPPAPVFLQHEPVHPHLSPSYVWNNITFPAMAPMPQLISAGEPIVQPKLDQVEQVPLKSEDVSEVYISSAVRLRNNFLCSKCVSCQPVRQIHCGTCHHLKEAHMKNDTHSCPTDSVTKESFVCRGLRTCPTFYEAKHKGEKMAVRSELRDKNILEGSESRKLSQMTPEERMAKLHTMLTDHKTKKEEGLTRSEPECVKRKRQPDTYVPWDLCSVDRFDREELLKECDLISEVLHYWRKRRRIVDTCLNDDISEIEIKEPKEPMSETGSC